LKAVESKFRQHDELRVLLLATGDATLIEHTENDDFWETAAMVPGATNSVPS